MKELIKDGEFKRINKQENLDKKSAQLGQPAYPNVEADPLSKQSKACSNDYKSSKNVIVRRVKSGGAGTSLANKNDPNYPQAEKEGLQDK